MTENEAIDKLNNLHYKILHSSFSSMVYESEIEALCMAKDCLKEIQQYREIGTVDEVAEMSNSYINYFHKVRQYLAIGTIEEFKALKEKSVAKKPKINRIDKDTIYCNCPTCKLTTVLYNDCIMTYCKECGQKLDWE